MKFFTLLLSLIFFTVPSFALNISNEKESTNVEVAPPFAPETRPLSDLITFVVANKGSLSKVKEDKIEELKNKINASGNRLPLPDCEQIYYAEFPDGSGILIQAAKGDLLLVDTKLVVDKGGKEGLPENIKIILSDMVIVIPGGTNV